MGRELRTAASSQSFCGQSQQGAGPGVSLGTYSGPVAPMAPSTALPPPLPRMASSHSAELKAMRMLQSSFLEKTQDSCFSDPGALACGPCSCLYRRHSDCLDSEPHRQKAESFLLFVPAHTGSPVPYSGSSNGSWQKILISAVLKL